MLYPRYWKPNICLAIICVLSLSGCSLMRSKNKDWNIASATTSPVPSPISTPAGGSTNSTTSHKLELAIAMETADLARKRGMDDEAITQYLLARSLDPNVKGVAHPLAVLYDRAGRMDAADREYRIAIADQGDNADLLSDYGYFLYSRGRHEEAESTLRTALKKHPAHHQATINLALVVGARGNYDEAQKLFTEAIGPAAALHNIGMLKLRAGDQVGAMENLREATNQDPSLTEARIVLAKLSGNGRY